ncbi:Protein ltv1 [Mactra antiquata]
MPSKKKKPFIDKKKAITFHLVHRSQQDPLLVCDDGTELVLVPETGKKEVAECRKEEQRKFGVFFDDDYDYMQHLKDTNEIYEVEMVDGVTFAEENNKGPSLRLPSSALPSDFEKKIGLLNQAVPIRGPQPDWDPDIVEALDDDFDYENPDNQLEDDFIQMANPEGGQGHDDSDLEEVSDLDSDVAQMSDNDDFDGDFQYGDRMFMDEETKSRFTNYSMSSSVIRRNQGLSLLDDKFEKLYEEYDDAEIGALDDDDIDGNMQQGNKVLDSIVEQFELQQKQKTLGEALDDESENVDADVISDDDDDSDDDDLVCVEMKPEEKWDCESILSTYSNLYNHPKLIEEPKTVKEIKLGKFGMPVDDIANRGLTLKEINQEMNYKNRTDKASTYRPKDETKEERIERKKAVKEERKERRQEKKQNKKAFTQEKIRQSKEIINVNQNLKGLKIV